MKANRIVMTVFTLIVMFPVIFVNNIGKISFDNDADDDAVVTESLEDEELVITGTEIIELTKVPTIESERVDVNTDENTCIYEAEIYKNSYSAYNLNGLFGQLEFTVEPYSFGNGAEAEIDVVDADRNIIISRTRIKDNSIPQDISVDIKGINEIEILVYPVNKYKTHCLLEEMLVYPSDGSVVKLSDDESGRVNLKELTPYYSHKVDEYTNKALTVSDRLWDNSLEFISEVPGEIEAENIYELNKEYKALEFKLYPNYFYNEKTTGLFIIKDEETGKILYKQILKEGDEARDVEVDITGVNYLKISYTSQSNLYYTTTCLIDDVYLYKDKEK